MKGRKIQANGIELQIYQYGNRHGEAILFLHPQGSSSRIWEKAISYFETDYQIVLLDLRGHGESEKATFGYDIYTLCKDLLCVLDSLTINKSHLVGSSLGGDIATAFASFYPERILSLTNIDSGMINYLGHDGERNLSKEQVLAEFSKREVHTFTNQSELLDYVESIFPRDIWDSYFEHWFKYVSIYNHENGKISYQIPPSINVQIMDMICDLTYKELYQNISCPILFLPAEKEENLLVKLKNIEEATKRTFVKTVIIPGSKHLLVLDQSQDICDVLLQFYQETNGIKFKTK